MTGPQRVRVSWRRRPRWGAAGNKNQLAQPGAFCVSQWLDVFPVGEDTLKCAHFTGSSSPAHSCVHGSTRLKPANKVCCNPPTRCEDKVLSRCFWNLFVVSS